MKWERILEDRTFFSKAIQSPMVAWHCKDLWPLLNVSLVILLYGRNYCYIPDFLFYKCSVTELQVEDTYLSIIIQSLTQGTNSNMNPDRNLFCQ